MDRLIKVIFISFLHVNLRVQFYKNTPQKIALPAYGLQHTIPEVIAMGLATTMVPFHPNYSRHTISS